MTTILCYVIMQIISSQQSKFLVESFAKCNFTMLHIVSTEVNVNDIERRG